MYVRIYDESQYYLQVTVLVRSADTKGLLINFDKHLLMCLKEAEYMIKNAFDVPDSARILLFSKQRMKGNMQLQCCLWDFSN